MPVQSDAYFVALRDEVKAEIAKIEAEEIGLEELVEKLALTRVRLRRMQAYAIDQKRILARYRGRVKSLVGDVEKQVNARRKYADRLENSIKKMHELLPMAFEEGKKAIAVRGATARHAENRAIKQDVFDWLDANPPKPRGKDAAAAAIAGGVVPVTFRTARKWIDEWENLRSTGTV